MTAGKALLAVLVAGLGCASVSQAPPDLDAQAKLFVPDPDRALVYVYRPHLGGFQSPAPVVVDGVSAGPTRPHTFFLFSVEPGHHTILSIGNENVSQVEKEMEAGRLYFVRLDLPIGVFGPRAVLHHVPEARGREQVASCCTLILPVPQ